MSDLSIDLQGETVILLPERALFWPHQDTLFIADTHWGKAATFRAAAVALPGGTTSADLGRLDRAIGRTAARRLVILGDLIHARAGRAERTFEAIGAWRARHADLEISLVRGNHDRGAGDPPEEWRIACLNAPHVEPPFVFQHFPQQASPGYALAGHLHPAAALAGAGRQRLKLPCFWFGPRVGVLPAFSGFTGVAAVAPMPGDRVFVIAEDEVIGVPS